MSISPIAASGMREHLRALERAATSAATPRSFESDLEAASAPPAEARPTVPAARAVDPLPRTELSSDLISAMHAHRAFTANLAVLHAEDEMTSTLVKMKR
jgi:hypothetical protein